MDIRGREIANEILGITGQQLDRFTFEQQDFLIALASKLQERLQDFPHVLRDIRAELSLIVAKYYAEMKYISENPRQE